LPRQRGWDVRPSRAAATDLEAALKAGAAGRLVLFVSPGSRVPTCLTHVLVPHDATPATSAVRGAPLWSHAEIVVLHVAAAGPLSEPGSLPAPRMIDHDCYDWSDWREEFVRRCCRFSRNPGQGGVGHRGVRAVHSDSGAPDPADLLSSPGVACWRRTASGPCAPSARWRRALCCWLLVAAGGQSEGWSTRRVRGGDEYRGRRLLLLRWRATQLQV
jgi:hypothetical protein